MILIGCVLALFVGAGAGLLAVKLRERGMSFGMTKLLALFTTLIIFGLFALLMSVIKKSQPKEQMIYDGVIIKSPVYLERFVPRQDEIKKLFANKTNVIRSQQTPAAGPLKVFTDYIELKDARDLPYADLFSVKFNNLSGYESIEINRNGYFCQYIKMPGGEKDSFVFLECRNEAKIWAVQVSAPQKLEKQADKVINSVQFKI